MLHPISAVRSSAGLLTAALALACAAPLFAVPADHGIDYDIVYVRQPRYGDDVNTIWPEIFHPARAEPGADLVLLHPDGSEEILVDCDRFAPSPTLSSPSTAEWVYYAYFHDQSPKRLSTDQRRRPAPERARTSTESTSRRQRSNA